LQAQFPNAVMVHTPVHASWLNQVEIFFSIIQRKVLTPKRLHRHRRDYPTPDRLRTRYNQNAKPFKWKLTTTDLRDFLQRLDRHTD